MSDYIELHCHSCFSLLDGASEPEALLDRAWELGMSALALTDHDGLYGAVRFYVAAQERGIHPIIGAELTLMDDEDPRAYPTETWAVLGGAGPGCPPDVPPTRAHTQVINSNIFARAGPDPRRYGYKAPLQGLDVLSGRPCQQRRARRVESPHPRPLSRQPECQPEVTRAGTRVAGEGRPPLAEAAVGGVRVCA